MKKYSSFSKYFNTNPRLWIIVLGIVVEILIVLPNGVAIGAVVKELGRTAGDKIAISIVCIIGFVWCLGMTLSTFVSVRKIYLDQITLVNARIGKELKKRGYNVLQSLDEMEAELSSPMLAQIHSGFNRSFNFIITKNWIIGTDDLTVMRANAIRISDISSVDLNEISTYHVRQGGGMHVTGKHYCRVKLTDKDNRSYCFSVRDEECQREAYDYITQNIMPYINREKH